MNERDFKNFYVMNMAYFLSNYVDENIPDNAYSLSHSDLLGFGFPGVKRIANKDVKVADILSGQVLLVKAPSTVGRKSIICAYRRPSLVLEKAEKGRKK